MMDDFMQAYLLKGQEFELRNLRDMCSLIDDEMDELLIEVETVKLNKANVVKETIDIIYVATQRLRRMGVDVDAALNEVHRSNMSKALPLDGSVSVEEELGIARKRYPNAGVKYGQRVAVLICGNTSKVIKPTTYSPAVITSQIIGE